MLESSQEYVRRDVLKRINDGAIQEVADEIVWLQHSLATLRDAILAHKKEKEAQYDPLPALMHEDVTLWSHVME